MSTDLLHALLEQIDWHWTTHLRPRLDGLTDDEYFWEPAPGCWTIRRRGERFVGDWQWPPPDPAPFTTIAWRLVHMAGPCLDWRKRELIDGETVDVENYPYPGTADDALALLDQGYGAWMDAMRALGDRVLEPMRPRAGQYADDPWMGMILHNNRELIHHGAEVSLLRDLYRARNGRP